MRRLLIIPAAGAGSRLGSTLPKLLVPVGGRPMLDHLLALYEPWIDRAIVVVAPGAADLVRAHIASLTSCAVKVDLAFQAEPTGMLDAILAPASLVRGFSPDRVWITWCDQIAVHPSTLAHLAQIEDRSPAALILPTSPGPQPYVHLLRDETGRIVRILHRREGDEMPEVGESEMGVFSLSRAAFGRDLDAFARDVEVGSTTRERNYLPFIPWLASRDEVVTFPCRDRMEALGINTPEDLREVETYLSGRSPKVLTIVIPAYNEERFIGTLLERIKAVDLASLDVSPQIIVVDDCSRDRTSEVAGAVPGVIVERHATNGGKGQAVRTGLARAKGDYLIIQDADLEYDPDDYLPMLRALREGPADIVYGSRYLKHPSRGKLANLLSGKHPSQTWTAFLGGQSLSFVALALTGHYLSDTVTALKLFRRRVLDGLALETTGFELDHEITAKVLARGFRIVEVPIKYFPRSRAEGKKIGLRDWFIGIRTFARYRKG